MSEPAEDIVKALGAFSNSTSLDTAAGAELDRFADFWYGVRREIGETDEGVRVRCRERERAEGLGADEVHPYTPADHEATRKRMTNIPPGAHDLVKRERRRR